VEHKGNKKRENVVEGEVVDNETKTRVWWRFRVL
jgi:hypothetical protein